MKHCHGEKGYILAEIIVALSLATIVAAALMTTYCSAYRVFQHQLVATDLQYAARAAMQMIIEDIITAQEVTPMEEGKKLRLDDGDITYYYRQDRTLYRHGKAKMPVANDINSVSFYSDSRPGYTIIYIEAGRGTEVYRCTSSACPRVMKVSGRDSE
ncbi:MAG TPA: type II secretion system protein [Syntrophomonas sp.]|nr:type II secretion system protein [Syntrophomonas sp.]